MRWQFGGNLQPVRMVCEFDWRECPSAVINYVWSEIVTDVVDCLTNEALMWRVIAMLFVCTLLVHTIYSKAKWMDETTINRENLNIIGGKVQDLELRVNILTYKMQYGTWPLPRQIQGTEIEGGLKNVRLTLTNSSDRSNWLKHMLLSPTENSAYLPYAKIGPRSVRCLTKLINLETKYMSSRFSREASPASHKVKASGSSSEKSIKYEISKNSLEMLKTDKNPAQNFEEPTNVPKYSPKSSRRDTNNSWSETKVLNYKEYPKLLSRQQRSCGNDLNVSIKISPTTKKSEDFGNYSSHYTSTQDPNHRDYKKSLTKQGNSLEYDSTRFPTAPRKSEIIDKTPEERVNSTQETLHKVTQKLENLHNVLRICSSSDCMKNTHDEDCSNKELAESILQDLKNLGNLPNESESDGKTSATLPLLLDSNTEESQVTKDEEDSTSDFEQCQSDRNSSSARSLENSLDIQNNDFPEDSSSKNMLEAGELEESTGKNPQISHVEMANLENCSPIISRDSSFTEISPLTKIQSLRSLKEDRMKIEHLQEEKEFLPTSFASSQVEFSKESDPEEKSNTALLQEAMKFKKALLTQIELEDSQKNIENNRLLKSEESEEESEESWPKVKNYFQSKLLDIISEEQSASSSTEKSNKPLSYPNTLVQTQQPDELKLKKTDLEVSNSIPENSKLAVGTKSSEYFSLSNLEEKMLAQDVVSSTAKDTLDTSSDFTEDELCEANETAVEEQDHILQKNITDLVNQSVQNIREYIEVFSKMQNDAILETKKVIDENLTNASNNLKDCSSDDSIMHFVNTVAIVDSMSEQLPKELPELAINSLVDLEAELSEDETENSNYKPDYALKRRPGSISLTEQNSVTNIQEFAGGALDSRSGFESALSEAEDDCRKISEPENPISEPSCKELVMDYLLESDSEFTDDKLMNALNLIEFEEENEPRAKDDERKTVDSPLTGRTVIRATSSLTTNLESESSSLDRSYNTDFEETGNLSNLERDKTIRHDQNFHHDEINDPDKFSSSETECKEFSPRIVDLVENLPEDNTWVSENLKDERTEQCERNVDENLIDAKDSVINESLTELVEFLERNEGNNLAKRPNSGDTVIITNLHEISSENEEIQSKANLSSDTSGSYVDADSHHFLNCSGMSLSFDKSIINSSTTAETLGVSKSARGSNSSPLQQRIPWNAPKKGSSLNNATAVWSKKPETTKSKLENLNISKTKSLHSKPTRSQSSGRNQLKVQSSFNIDGTKDLESTMVTPERQAGKSNVNLPQRRSRSYTTPRKTESSPRNSATSQQNVQRVSRARKESEKSKISLEKSENSQKSQFSKKEEFSQKSKLPKKDKTSQKSELLKEEENSQQSEFLKEDNRSQDSKKYENREFLNKLEKNDFSDKSEKSVTGISAGSSLKSCVTKTPSKSCIPLLKSRIRAKSPMRGPLTMSTSSWREETLRTPNSVLENIQAEGSVTRSKENSLIIQSPGPSEVLEKKEVKSSEKMPENRTVIYVNIVTEQEHTATRVVNPKKFLEYLKDRELKIQSVLDQEIGTDASQVNNASSGSCSSPRILTVVSSAADGKISTDILQQNRVDSNNSAQTSSWSLRVEQKEIEVSAKPSVMDMSTSISDLPEISAESRGNLEKFQIFEVPKELTKDEYIILLEALNQDPNLHQLKEMHKLCNKLGLGFHE